MDTYEKCIAKLPAIVNRLLCLPMKVTFICNIGDAFSNEHGICDPSHEIDNDFGENYAELKDIQHTFLANFSNAKINYSVINERDNIGLE